MLHNKPIKIGILEASPQTKAVLKFFFSSSGKTIFKESSLDDASVFIMDYDYPGTKESWENLFSTTKKPGIVISIKETNIPFTYWIAKPLTTKDLFEAGEKVKELIEKGFEEAVIETIDEPVKEEQNLDDVLQVAIEQEKKATIEKTIEKELEIKEPVKKKVKAKLAATETDDSLESSLDAPESFEEPLTEAKTTIEKTEDKAKPSVEKSDDILDSSFDFSDSFEDSLLETETVTEATDTFDHIDSSSINSKNENDLDIEPALIESNETFAEKTELISAIPTATDFSISPNLIEISDDLIEISETDAQLVEITPSSMQEISLSREEKDKNLEESEIDSLLQTLISGGKSNHLEEELSLNPSSILTKEKDLDIIGTNKNKLDSVAPTEKEAITLKAEELKSGFIDFEIDTLAKNSEEKQQDDATLDITPTNTNETSKATTKKSELLDFTLDSPPDEEDALNISPPLKSVDSNVTEDISLIQNNSEFGLDETLSTEQIGKSIHIDPVKAEDFTPISAEDELQILLDEIRKEAEKGVKKVTSSSMFIEKNNGQIINHIPTSAEERWVLTCGTNKKITNAKEQAKIQFDPESHMLSVLLDVCEQSKQTDKILRLKFKRYIIVVDYNRDFVYYDSSIFSDEYASLCQQMVLPGVIKVHGLDKSEIRSYRKKITDNPERAHTIDSFIWTTSLLTSKGRLPKDTDINKKVGLKYWPDLTRLEQIPDAMQVAAIFYKHPGSLLEISSWSTIDQCYIFAFYNASLSLGLIEFDEKKFRLSSQDPKNSSKKTKNRGFFSRLLKRIKS